MLNEQYNDIRTLFGIAINNGDYIIYFNNSKIAYPWKKGIWKVTLDSGDMVELLSISNNNKFTTKKEYCINIKFIKQLGFFTTEFITQASLDAYEKLISEEQNDTTIFNGDNFINIHDNIINELNENLLKEEEKMSKFKVLMNSNVNAAKTGAVITAGKTLNGILKEKIADAAPRKYRALIKHPLADVVIANVASIAIGTFASNNYKAKIAADAMMEAAMIELFSSFNFEKMISDVLSNVDLESLVTTEEDI